MSDKPKKYLLVTETSVYIPGDERSRTNPGHGYPERTERYPQLRWFSTEEELLAYLEGYSGRSLSNPEIYEIAGTVRVERKLQTSLIKG